MRLAPRSSLRIAVDTKNAEHCATIFLQFVILSLSKDLFQPRPPTSQRRSVYANNPTHDRASPGDTAMHLITLGFDDGFIKSNLKIAEIFEKHHLAACFNIIATGHRPDYVPPDPYQAGPQKGDFKLWNELQARGHEIQPHGYRHANKAKLPFAESQTLIRDCLAIFHAELAGFNPQESIFAFPYSATTPELEQWLPTVVRAFRAGGTGFNPLPHPQLNRLSTIGFGPGNCDQHLDVQVAKLLAQPSGWLVYTGHGLDDEGWGPLSPGYLDQLLGRLTAIPTVKVLPAGAALRDCQRPTNCKCETPPFLFSDYVEKEIGTDSLGAEVSLHQCKCCGQTWLKYLREEAHYTKSGRWWRTAVPPEVCASVTVEMARPYIEHQPWCFVGGSYFDSTGKLQSSPIKIV